jgi:hypothetical protein
MRCTRLCSLKPGVTICVMIIGCYLITMDFASCGTLLALGLGPRLFGGATVGRLFSIATWHQKQGNIRLRDKNLHP